MAWPGYWEYGGTEVISAARTEAYCAHAGMGWFKPGWQPEATASVPYLLGDEPYSTPLQDDAPWVDHRDPDTFDFYGVYPLDVGGVEDSTWQAQVVENTDDGGVVGGVRRSTRTVVFSTVLVGASTCAVEAGMRWLREALGGRPCLGPENQCGGHDLCYFRCPPELDFTIDDPNVADCLPDFLRTLRNVTLTVGPTVEQKMYPTGGAAWVVTFTAVAGNPFEWGQETPLIQGFCDPKVDIPYTGGVVPEGGTFDEDGSPFVEVTCPKPSYQPYYDVACGNVIPPPVLPDIALSCFNPDVSYTRRFFTIPSAYVPLWNEAVPWLQIRATKEVRNLRLRFYADVLGVGDPATDPCNFCGDIVFSYIGAGDTMIFDGADRLVYVQDPGGTRRRADSVVFGSDGGPFEWPQLSCGLGYVVTVDTQKTAVPPIIDFSLYGRAA